MKKLLSFVFVVLASFAVNLSSFAQEIETISPEKMLANAEKTSENIAKEIGLSQDEEMLLTRQIYAREELLRKVKVNQNNPNSTQDFSEYISQANDRFKTSVAELFGSNKAQKILALYSLDEE